jgi:hypothetical protein
MRRCSVLGASIGAPSLPAVHSLRSLRCTQHIFVNPHSFADRRLRTHTTPHLSCKTYAGINGRDSKRMNGKQQRIIGCNELNIDARRIGRYRGSLPMSDRM